MEDVTVGILGLGRGFAHLRNFLATDDARVIGACDWYESRHDCANTHLASVGKKAELMRNYDDLLALQPGCDRRCQSREGLGRARVYGDGSRLSRRF